MALGEDIEMEWILSDTVTVLASDVQVYHLFLNAKQNNLEQVYRISCKLGVSEVHCAEPATLRWTSPKQLHLIISHHPLQ